MSEDVCCNIRNVKLLNIPCVIYLLCLLPLFVFSLSPEIEMAQEHARMFMIHNPIIECKNHVLFLTKITKITKTDTLVVTKMAEKPYPLIWGRTYLYSPYKGMNPPPSSPGCRAHPYGSNIDLNGTKHLVFMMS